MVISAIRIQSPLQPKRPLASGTKAPAFPRFAAAPSTGRNHWLKAGLLGVMTLLPNMALAQKVDKPTAEDVAKSPSAGSKKMAPISKEAYLKDHKIRFAYFESMANDIYFRQTDNAEKFKPHQDLVLDRLYDLLKNNPELLNHISKTLDVHFYAADSVTLTGDPNVVGWVDNDQKDPHRSIMSLTTGKLKKALKNGSDAYEVIAHELAHVIDDLQPNGTYAYADGFFPHWDSDVRKKFKSARFQEWNKNNGYVSAVRNYGFKNNNEFLAVLVETYFEQPRLLQEINPFFYDTLEDCFHHYQGKELPEISPTLSTPAQLEADEKQRVKDRNTQLFWISLLGAAGFITYKYRQIQSRRNPRHW